MPEVLVLRGQPQPTKKPPFAVSIRLDVTSDRLGYVAIDFNADDSAANTGVEPSLGDQPEGELPDDSWFIDWFADDLLKPVERLAQSRQLSP